MIGLVAASQESIYRLLGIQAKLVSKEKDCRTLSRLWFGTSSVYTGHSILRVLASLPRQVQSFTVTKAGAISSI
jgi:hypothetical protein